MTSVSVAIVETEYGYGMDENDSGLVFFLFIDEICPCKFTTCSFNSLILLLRLLICCRIHDNSFTEPCRSLSLVPTPTHKFPVHAVAPPPCPGSSADDTKIFLWPSYTYRSSCVTSYRKRCHLLSSLTSFAPCTDRLDVPCTAPSRRDRSSLRRWHGRWRPGRDQLLRLRWRIMGGGCFSCCWVGEDRSTEADSEGWGWRGRAWGHEEGQWLLLFYYV